MKALEVMCYIVSVHVSILPVQFCSSSVDSNFTLYLEHVLNVITL